MFIFPDTHFFLHFKHPQEIPWSAVTSADPIYLIVGRTVQKEIERHKYEMRGRPQDRARDYANKLGQVVSSGQPLVLRDQNPRVFLDYRSQRPSGWLPPSELDASWNDDMLVADVLAFAKLNPSVNFAVLTGDPGLMARLKTFDVAHISLSGRGWELPAEKTPQEKELEKLRLENETLRRVGPKIVCDVQQDGQDAREIILRGVRYPSLTQGEIEALIHEMATLHPRIDDFANSSEPSLWSLPSRERIERYHREYDTWLSDLHIFLNGAAERLGDSVVSADVQVSIFNDGSGPADHAVLAIETIDGFLLFDLDDQAEDPGRAAPSRKTQKKFRQPPAPPKSARVRRSGARSVSLSSWNNLTELGLSSSMAELGLSSATILTEFTAMGPSVDIATRFAALSRKDRERHSFYWKQHPNRSGEQGWQLECEDFLHHLRPVKFTIRITKDASEEARGRGVLKVRLLARNIREPFERQVPIRTEIVEASTREALMALLPM